MKNKKIGIVGNGYVGKAFVNFFKDNFDVAIYDPAYAEHSTAEQKWRVNQADLAVVCVPTPQAKDGSADLTAIEEVIGWLETPLILIKSAIPPNTVNRLVEKFQKKQICVSPEFIGEGKYFVPFWKYPHPTDAKLHDFFVIGGEEPYRTKIIDIFQTVLGPSCKIYKMSSTEAEIVKYMENSWGATKVTFANEFYEICKSFGADYQKVREGFLADGRVERMHTMVLEEKRGFGGKCFPKDLSAIVKASINKGYQPELLEQVLKSNDKFVKLNPTWLK